MAKEKEDKKPTIEEILAGYKKTNGKDSISYLSDGIVQDKNYFSSGSLKIDMLIGNGSPMGFPEGGIVELFGPSASMKSTIAMYAIASYQKKHPKGRDCVYIDVEYTFSKSLAEKIGIDTNRLIVLRPKITEEIFTIIDEFVESGAIGVIVVDSVAAMVPLREFEGEYGDSIMGKQAGLMSQGLRKLNEPVNANETCLIFVNQIRHKLNVMYGSPETTTGGNALEFYSSVRLRCSSTKLDGKEPARQINITLDKSKLSAALKGTKTEITYILSQGINRNAELVEIATDLGIIKKAGSWYSYGEIKLGQGTGGAIELLESNPEFAEEIYNKIIDTDVAV